MIQRKQTLFLLFSVIIMIGYFFVPLIQILSHFPRPQFVTVMSPYLSTNVDFPVIHHYFVFWCAWAAGITAALNFIAIFLFKFRKVQIILCWLTILTSLYCFCYVYYRMMTSDMIQDQLFYYGNISPVVSAIFTFLAMFFIRKDEELVKSVDRLR